MVGSVTFFELGNNRELTRIHANLEGDFRGSTGKKICWGQKLKWRAFFGVDSEMFEMAGDFGAKLAVD
jgi:hypothetical protein